MNENINDCVYRKYTYIYFSSFKMNVKNPKPLLYNLIFLFLKMIRRIILLEFSYPNLRTIFYFEPSLNNRKTLKSTKNKLPNDLITSCKKFTHFFPEAWVYIYSFLNIFSFLKFYNSLNKEDAELVRFYFPEFFLSMGHYIVIDECLKNNPQLKVIVMANDHVVISMCLKDLAPKYNVKTIYTQHASVTERFPSLNFDYSFLDGMESYKKYEKIGNIKGNVYLSGSPRFDEIYNIIIKHREEKRIGIAINALDNISKVKDLCHVLIDNGYNNILLRPHQNIENRVDWSSFHEMGIDISMPSVETSFPFLNRVTCLISNESGIHLDAAIFGVPSILFNFSDNNILDWYGYVRIGLMSVASNYKELLLYLPDIKPVNDAVVQYFVASHKTHLQGKIGDVIGGYISAIISDKDTKFLDKSYFAKSTDTYFVIKH